jgi:uncharacterized protein involved in tolerance to divalent cations
VAPEPTDDFERELHQAFERRPAPPSLKRKVMERRRRQNTERLRHRVVFMQRLAACIVLTGALSGLYAWHSTAERRKGEEAREQVFTALRIANHALSEMNAQLAARKDDTK